jgi:hypothetical protein
MLNYLLSRNSFGFTARSALVSLLQILFPEKLPLHIFGFLTRSGLQAKA